MKLYAVRQRLRQDKEQAKRLRAEAEAQLELLLEARGRSFSDFYSYRYFASEGFLPGYNFPRLPLSAYIPGRRGRRREDQDEFLSRPRFLAISEFGPRSIIYHEGSRYVINKAILPVAEDDLLTTQAKVCDACGYLHPITDQADPDRCENCGCHAARPHAITVPHAKRLYPAARPHQQRRRRAHAYGLRAAEPAFALPNRTAVPPSTSPP